MYHTDLAFRRASLSSFVQIHRNQPNQIMPLENTTFCCILERLNADTKLMPCVNLFFSSLFWAVNVNGTNLRLVRAGIVVIGNDILNVRCAIPAIAFFNYRYNDIPAVYCLVICNPKTIMLRQYISPKRCTSIDANFLYLLQTSKYIKIIQKGNQLWTLLKRMNSD